MNGVRVPTLTTPTKELQAQELAQCIGNMAMAQPGGVITGFAIVLFSQQGQKMMAGVECNVPDNRMLAEAVKIITQHAITRSFASGQKTAGKIIEAVS